MHKLTLLTSTHVFDFYRSIGPVWILIILVLDASWSAEGGMVEHAAEPPVVHQAPTTTEVPATTTTEACAAEVLQVPGRDLTVMPRLTTADSWIFQNRAEPYIYLLVASTTTPRLYDVSFTTVGGDFMLAMYILVDNNMQGIGLPVPFPNVVAGGTVSASMNGVSAYGVKVVFIPMDKSRSVVVSGVSLSACFTKAECEVDSLRVSDGFILSFPRNPSLDRDSWQFQDNMAPYISLLVTSVTVPKLAELSFTVNPMTFVVITYTFINEDLSYASAPVSIRSATTGGRLVVPLFGQLSFGVRLDFVPLDASALNTVTDVVLGACFNKEPITAAIDITTTTTTETPVEMTSASCVLEMLRVSGENLVPMEPPSGQDTWEFQHKSTVSLSFKVESLTPPHLHELTFTIDPLTFKAVVYTFLDEDLSIIGFPSPIRNATIGGQITVPLNGMVAYGIKVDLVPADVLVVSSVRDVGILACITKAPVEETTTAVPTEHPLETTTTQPPVETTTQPPVETTTQPPVETTTQPPVETTTQPPVETTTQPPVETTTQPPVETTTQPPVETTTQPPVETTTQPPVETTEPVTAAIDITTATTTKAPVETTSASCIPEMLRVSGEYLVPMEPPSAPDTWEFQDKSTVSLSFKIESLTPPHLQELTFTVDPSAFFVIIYRFLDEDLSVIGFPSPIDTATKGGQITVPLNGMVAYGVKVDFIPANVSAVSSVRDLGIRACITKAPVEPTTTTTPEPPTEPTTTASPVETTEACEFDSIRASGEFLDGMPRSPISPPDSWYFQDIKAPYILLLVKSLTLPRLDELRFTLEPGAVFAATYTLKNPDMTTNGAPTPIQNPIQGGPINVQLNGDMSYAIQVDFSPLDASLLLKIEDVSLDACFTKLPAGPTTPVPPVETTTEETTTSHVEPTVKMDVTTTTEAPGTTTSPLCIPKMLRNSVGFLTSSVPSASPDTWEFQNQAMASFNLMVESLTTPNLHEITFTLDEDSFLMVSYTFLDKDSSIIGTPVTIREAFIGGEITVPLNGMAAYGVKLDFSPAETSAVTSVRDVSLTACLTTEEPDSCDHEMLQVSTSGGIMDRFPPPQSGVDLDSWLFADTTAHPQIFLMMNINSPPQLFEVRFQIEPVTYSAVTYIFLNSDLTFLGTPQDAGQVIQGGLITVALNGELAHGVRLAFTPLDDSKPNTVTDVVLEACLVPGPGITVGLPPPTTEPTVEPTPESCIPEMLRPSEQYLTSSETMSSPNTYQFQHKAKPMIGLLIDSSSMPNLYELKFEVEATAFIHVTYTLLDEEGNIVGNAIAIPDVQWGGAITVPLHGVEAWGVVLAFTPIDEAVLVTISDVSLSACINNDENPKPACHPECSCFMDGVFYGEGDEWQEKGKPCITYRCNGATFHPIVIGCEYKDTCRRLYETWVDGCVSLECQLNDDAEPEYRLIEARCEDFAEMCVDVGDHRQFGCSTTECQINDEGCLQMVYTDGKCMHRGVCRDIAESWHDGCSVFHCVMQNGAPIPELVTSDPIHWPVGHYALIMPFSGCPDKDWDIGRRLQYADGKNYFQPEYHLNGTRNASYVENYFCVHDESKREASLDWGFISNWTQGKYCIQRHNDACPEEFTKGSITFDDANGMEMFNEVEGIMPDGDYGNDTSLSFCCRNDGNVTDELILPRRKPFVLFMGSYASSCQMVRGMSVEEVFLEFDDEDDNPTSTSSGTVPRYDFDGYSSVLHFCHYTPLGCGCVSGSGDYIPQGSRFEEFCQLYECQSINSGGDLGLELVRRGCQFDDSCYAETSMWYDQYCAQHFCLNSTIEGDDSLEVYEVAQGCLHNGECYHIGDHRIDHCTDFICYQAPGTSFGTWTLDKSECYDPYGGCHEIGSTWEEKDVIICSNITCIDQDSLAHRQVNDIGCLYGDTCMSANENTILDADCNVVSCTVQSTMLMPIEVKGCVFEGQCLVPGSTRMDECKELTCSIIPDQEQCDWKTTQNECKGADGECHPVGTTWHNLQDNLCVENICKAAANFHCYAEHVNKECGYDGECIAVNATKVFDLECKYAKCTDSFQMTVHFMCEYQGHCIMPGSSFAVPQLCMNVLCGEHISGIPQPTFDYHCNFNGRCYELGDMVSGLCTDFICQDEDGTNMMVPVKDTCTDMYGVCHDAGSTWMQNDHEGLCITWLCRNHLEGNVITRISTTCRHNDICIEPGETYADMDDCQNIHCVYNVTADSYIRHLMSRCLYHAVCYSLGDEIPQNCQTKRCVQSSESQAEYWTAIKTGCVTSDNICQQEGGTWREEDYSCRSYTCVKDGDDFVNQMDSEVCRYSGKCVEMNSTVSVLAECKTVSCVEMDGTKISHLYSSSCKDVNGICFNVGQTWSYTSSDFCFNYICEQQGHYYKKKVLDGSCNYNNECIAVGQSVDIDECTKLKCTGTNTQPIAWTTSKCSHNGLCYNLGESVIDNCSPKTCTEDQVDYHEYWEAQNGECLGSDGNCYAIGASWTIKTAGVCQEFTCGANLAPAPGTLSCEANGLCYPVGMIISRDPATCSAVRCDDLGAGMLHQTTFYESCLGGDGDCHVPLTEWTEKINHVCTTYLCLVNRGSCSPFAVETKCLHDGVCIIVGESVRLPGCVEGTCSLVSNNLYQVNLINDCQLDGQCYDVGQHATTECFTATCVRDPVTTHRDFSYIYTGCMKGTVCHAFGDEIIENCITKTCTSDVTTEQYTWVPSSMACSHNGSCYDKDEVIGEDLTMCTKMTCIQDAGGNMITQTLGMCQHQGVCVAGGSSLDIGSCTSLACTFDGTTYNYEYSSSCMGNDGACHDIDSTWVDTTFGLCQTYSCLLSRGMATPVPMGGECLHEGTCIAVDDSQRFEACHTVACHNVNGVLTSSHDYGCTDQAGNCYIQGESWEESSILACNSYTCIDNGAGFSIPSHTASMCAHEDQCIAVGDHLDIDTPSCQRIVCVDTGRGKLSQYQGRCEDADGGCHPDGATVSHVLTDGTRMENCVCTRDAVTMMLHYTC